MSKIKPLKLWQQHNLDSIIMNGDILYSHLSAKLNHDYILATELPEILEFQNKMFLIHCRNPYFGCVGTHCSDPLTGNFTLCDALSGALSQSHSLLFTMGSYLSAFTSAITRQNNVYWVFDSHSKNAQGLSCPDGTSIFSLILAINKCFVMH